MSRRTAIHWAGEVRGKRFWALGGFPCCCSGQRAIDITNEGLTTLTPERVTCKACLRVVRRDPALAVIFARLDR